MEETHVRRLMLKDKTEESADSLPGLRVLFEESTVSPELRAALDELRQVIIDAEISKLEFFADTAPVNPKIDLNQEGPLSLDEYLAVAKPFRFINVNVEGKQAVLDRATNKILFEGDDFFNIGRRIGTLREWALDAAKSQALFRQADQEMRRFQILREYAQHAQ